MRKSLMLAGVPVAAAGVAIAIVVARHGAKAPDKFSQDLKQAQAIGLDLAQAQSAKKYALTELAPASGADLSKSIKKGEGDKAIRSKSPTVKAAPEPVAAPVAEDLPQVEVIQNTPAPTTTVAAVPAVPRPEPQTMPAPESDQGPILAGGTGRGTGRTGGGEEGSIGATTIGGISIILGSIIRGGVVGGDDNCDPRSRRPGGSMSMPVYSNPSGMHAGGSPSYPGRRPRGR